MNLLTIGGIEISVESSDAISQTYTPVGGFATLRTLGGGLVRQRNWRRLKTSVSVGEARFLPALAGLDLDVPHTILCVAPRSITSAGPAVTLPAARRPDVAPYGFAQLPTGFMTPTPATLVGDVLSLAPVAGAVRYVACYLPAFDAVITEFTERFDVRGAVAGWDLTAEEV